MYISDNDKEIVINRDESIDDVPSFDKFITHCVILNFKAGDKKIIGFSAEEFAELAYNGYKDMMHELGFAVDSVVMQPL